MSVKDKDNGAKKLLRALDREISIKVGIIGIEATSGHSGSEMTNVEIGTKHEFGIGVPQRSFIREWFDQNVEQNKKLLNIIPRIMAKGRSPLQAATQVALRMAGDIQERISNGIPPENSPVTIEMKGSSTPLIDTGQLRTSITGVAEVKNG